MPAKRTEPSRSLLNQSAGFKYTNAASTNLAKKFADIRRTTAKAERDAQKAAQPAQAPLLLEAPSNVLPLTKTRAATAY